MEEMVAVESVRWFWITKLKSNRPVTTAN